MLIKNSRDSQKCESVLNAFGIMFLLFIVGISVFLYQASKFFNGKKYDIEKNEIHLPGGDILVSESYDYSGFTREGHSKLLKIKVNGSSNFENIEVLTDGQYTDMDLFSDRRSPNAKLIKKHDKIVLLYKGYLFERGSGIWTRWNPPEQSNNIKYFFKNTMNGNNTWQEFVVNLSRNDSVYLVEELDSEKNIITLRKTTSAHYPEFLIFYGDYFNFIESLKKNGFLKNKNVSVPNSIEINLVSVPYLSQVDENNLNIEDLLKIQDSKKYTYNLKFEGKITDPLSETSLDSQKKYYAFIQTK